MGGDTYLFHEYFSLQSIYSGIQCYLTVVVQYYTNPSPCLFFTVYCIVYFWFDELGIIVYFFFFYFLGIFTKICRCIKCIEFYILQALVGYVYHLMYHSNIFVIYMEALRYVHVCGHVHSYGDVLVYTFVCGHVHVLVPDTG